MSEYCRHCKELSDYLATAQAKCAELEQDLTEQCRLNGMGAEREAKLMGEVERLKREVAHWKSNHDNRVEAARVLIERNDLPLERAQAYKHYVALQDDLEKWKSAAMKSHHEVLELRAKLENETMRLSYCGVAATGYFDWCRDEHRSDSLDEVLKLRAKLAEAARQEPVAWMVGDETGKVAELSEGSLLSQYDRGYRDVPLTIKPQPADHFADAGKQMPTIPEGYKLVPDAIDVHSLEMHGRTYAPNYVAGWNACRAAVLAAAPQPEGMK